MENFKEFEIENQEVITGSQAGEEISQTALYSPPSGG